MITATLLVSGRDWLLPALGLVGAALAVLAWMYWRTPAAGGVRLTCAGLKILGLLALAICLLEPLWTGQRARPGANQFVLLADNSQGMQMKDRGDTRTRGETLRELLRPGQSGWQDKLNASFQVRRYLFDARLQSTRDFAELGFDGRSSALGGALRALATRYRSQPLAGVLLFTDGNATDLADDARDLAGLPPVYPVMIGQDAPPKDLAIQKVTVTQTAFEDAPVTIQADVTAAGYYGAKIVGQLIELDQPVTGKRHQKPAARTNQVVQTAGRAAVTADGERLAAELRENGPRDGRTISFRFQFRPRQSGLSFYRLRVSASDELEQFADPSKSIEATLANNSRVVVVDRGQGPYRILYVAGHPNWEYKFLRRAVEEDEQLDLVALIRVARREPKFQFKGRTGESSNPLFRGFDRKDEETQRYDQPVLVRLNTRDEAELRDGFPKTPEELYGYHAVVLDDLESEFFTHDQMTLLQKFVSERGGGFLMLGGQDSFNQGKYERTAIGNMLPVYLDRITDVKPLANLRLSMTREGWLQPWARLRSNESEERARLEVMPPFQIMNRTRDVKPGATIVATLSDSEGRQYPGLVVQRFGRGRTAALTVGDFWRWQLQQPDAHEDLAKAWRQTMRWLVADVPERISLQAAPRHDDPNQAVQLQARARDRKFQPLDNGTVTLTVERIEERSPGVTGAAVATNHPARPKAIHLSTEPALGEAALYETTYVPRETGGYRAEAVVIDAQGVEAGRAEVGWSVDFAAEEFRSLKPNRALLEAIARQTGGEMIAADKLEDFVRTLPNRKAPITESWAFPLWHTPAVFLFALICFVAEWGLRRWKGMA